MIGKRRSFKNRKWAGVVMAMVLVCSMVSVLSVNAQTTKNATGAVGSHKIKGQCAIVKAAADSYTSLSGSGSIRQTSTYKYVNTKTGKAGSSSKASGGVVSCSVSFAAPVNCKSVRIDSTHTVNAYGYTWSGTSYAIY